MKITFELSERETQLAKLTAYAILKYEDFDKFSKIIDESKDKEIILTTEDINMDARIDVIMGLGMCAVAKIAKDNGMEKS